jgi:hypothetical protein
MKTTTLPPTNSMNCASFRLALLLIPLALACFALSPQARATCQQGCLTNSNTVLGDDALVNNTTGYENTATGFQALFNNTTGHENTASGDKALTNNTTGYANTATGWQTLFSNTTGYFNTATGLSALRDNTTGFENTATGLAALTLNTTGFQNTASGIFALNLNTTGYDNTATGFSALANNTSGTFNTANGEIALYYNLTGSSNTAIGVGALTNNVYGSNNIAVGFEAGLKCATGNNNIYVGNRGSTATISESKTIRIGEQQGRTFIAGISGVTVAGGVGVIVDANGQLGTVVSSKRFKDGIKPMDRASEAILELKPVTFCYKHELDPNGIPQFGLVAEDVEKVNPDLVARDEQGNAYTVRYEAVNAMLLNEFLKEHRKVEKLEATVAQQHKDFEEAIAELKGQLQRVSAQVELSKAAPQTVLNNR